MPKARGYTFHDIDTFDPDYHAMIHDCANRVFAIRSTTKSTYMLVRDLLDECGYKLVKKAGFNADRAFDAGKSATAYFYKEEPVGIFKSEKTMYVSNTSYCTGGLPSFTISELKYLYNRNERYRGSRCVRK